MGKFPPFYVTLKYRLQKRNQNQKNIILNYKQRDVESTLN